MYAPPPKTRAFKWTLKHKTGMFSKIALSFPVSCRERVFITFLHSVVTPVNKPLLRPLLLMRCPT
jgi:hypothetical protein